MNAKTIRNTLTALVLTAAFLLGGSAVLATADPSGMEALALTKAAAPKDVTAYTLKAEPIDLAAMPGVYTVTARAGDSNEGDSPSTIGIPSVAKQNLADEVSGPTKEMPAIIMGAAVNFEKRTGPVDFEPLELGSERIAPYSYFRHGVIEEKAKNADGTTSTHKKLSGFDGSYYIIRVDVSEIIADAKEKAKDGNLEGKYLHVKQESNKALMAAYGLEGTTYSDAMGNKAGSYSLANDAAAMKDQGNNDLDKNTPYFDVIVLSSGKLAAGADEGKTDAPSADIKLSFYVDDKVQYNKLKPLDPNKKPTFPYTAGGVKYKTEADYNKAVLARFFDDGRVSAANSASGYFVKASDLEIDAAVDATNDWGDSIGPDGTYKGIDWRHENADFWSMTEAIAHQGYDDHTIKLICEVPVLTGLSIEGSAKRSVILDVNSFDIQIANNTEGKKPGLEICNNAQLRIMDSSNTSGAELAIGNNATMVIEKGGTMIIDETCTNEVEYDAGTSTDPSAPQENLLNGEITIKDGGTLINHGVVNIEGTEAKPLDPNAAEAKTGETTQTDMKSSDMVVEYGGTITNYGCLSIKGILYVLGTLNNYGRYDDPISAYDPDKGTTSYHKGIQVTWKDDVRQKGVEPGVLNVGIGAAPAGQDPVIEPRAVLNNYGDIVLVPGTFNLYGTLNNARNPELGAQPYIGHLFWSTVNEAIIPITPPLNDPTLVEKHVWINPPKQSVLNFENGTVVNEGEDLIVEASVELIHNGILGKLMTGDEAVTWENFKEKKAKAEALKTKIKHAKAGKSGKGKTSGKISLSWKKVKTSSGYQCWYSTTRKFSKNVNKKSVKGAGKTKMTLKKLKKGKTWYVKVRPYKDIMNPVSGKAQRVYGSWSKVKRVKIRK